MHTLPDHFPRPPSPTLNISCSTHRCVFGIPPTNSLARRSWCSRSARSDSFAVSFNPVASVDNSVVSRSASSRAIVATDSAALTAEAFVRASAFSAAAAASFSMASARAARTAAVAAAEAPSVASREAAYRHNRLHPRNSKRLFLSPHTRVIWPGKREIHIIGIPKYCKCNVGL